MKRILFASVAAAALWATPSFAADPGMPMEEAPVFSWTGAYIGGHAGYSWGRGGGDYFAPDGRLVEKADVDAHGWLGGVQAGYNYQMNNWVFGLEGDIAWSGADARNDIFALNGVDVADIEVDMDWLASVTARAGYAVDRTLFYAKGGIGFTDIKLGDSGNNGQPIVASGSETLTGWTVGGGVEHAFTDHWTIKGEYQFYRFDDSIALNWNGAPFRTYDDNIDVHTLKIGINYKF